MQFNPYFEMCALAFLLLTLTFILRNKALGDTQSRVFLFFVAVVIVNLASDIISSYTIACAADFPLTLNYILNTVYFLSQLAIPPIFAAYALVLVKSLTASNWRRWVPFFIPAVFFELAALTTFKTGFIFYFNEQFVYTRGPLFIVCYAYALFYTVYGTLSVIKHRSSIPKIQTRVVLIYVVLGLSAMILQFFFKEYLLAGAATALGLISMYMTFQNPDNYIDSMTDLFSRPAFLIILERLLNKSRDYDLLVFSVSRLSDINSTFGIKGGDEVLCTLASLLRSQSKNDQTAFRLGGNRFALLAEQARSSDVLAFIRARAAQPWNILGASVPININICHISLNELSPDRDEVLYTVDSAISYLISGSEEMGRYVKVDRRYSDEIHRRRTIERVLSEMDTNHCLHVCLQPIYDRAAGRFTGAEALLRMNCKELGSVSPSEFIPVAEHTGQIKQLGSFVLSEACRIVEQYRIWESGIGFMDVNLSVVECFHDELIQFSREKISRFCSGGTQLVFEITESVASNSAEAVKNVMERLTAVGASFALDDYGCGYSNNITITNLPFTRVKLDMSLLKACDGNPRAVSMYRGMVEMFGALGIEIISEGVETEEEVKLLTSLGVGLMQGFYYSRPLPEEEFIEFIRSRFPRPGGAGR